MKYAWKIWFGLIGFFLSANVFCQSLSSQLTHIKKYKASIDSLYRVYGNQGYRPDPKFKESVEEGEYVERGKDSIIGGFTIFAFSVADSVYKILFEARKRETHIAIGFYYKNGIPVYCDMEVWNFKIHNNRSYTVQEYYWNNKRIAKSTKNAWPDRVADSLIPVSLFNDGVAYYNSYYKTFKKE